MAMDIVWLASGGMRVPVWLLAIGLLISACTSSSDNASATTGFVFPPTTSMGMEPCLSDDVSVDVGGEGATAMSVFGFGIEIREGKACDVESNVTVTLSELDGMPLVIDGNPIRVQIRAVLHANNPRLSLRWVWSGCAPGDDADGRHRIVVVADITQIGRFEGPGITPRCGQPGTGSSFSELSN